MCSNCWKIRCHNFACNWLCLHWTFIDFFFICMGKKNYVNLCLKAKVKPCMERRECQRRTDNAVTVLPVFSFRPSFSLTRAKAQPSEGSEGKRDDWPSFSSCHNYLFLVFCFVLFCFPLLAISSDFAKSTAILFMHTACVLPGNPSKSWSDDMLYRTLHVKCLYVPPM